MSKTAKRVLTVMMVGLIEMLGVKAEAHYIVIKGRCYWHSLECYREDKEPDTRGPAPLVELLATPTIVEGLCNGIAAKLVLPDPPVTLAAPRTPIGEGDFTERRAPNGTIASRNLEVQRIVSDALLYQFSCPPPSSPDVTPTEVIVREWSSVQMNLYLKKNQSIPHSAWKAGTCTLSGTFDITDPNKLPPGGALYNCKETLSCHVDQGGQEKCNKL